MNEHEKRQTNRQVSRQTGRLEDSQACRVRQTRRHPDRQAGRETHMLTD